MALSVPEALEQRAEPSMPWGGRAKQEAPRLFRNGGQRRGRGRVSLTCLLSREHTFSAPSSPASTGIKPGSRTGQQGLGGLVGSGRRPRPPGSAVAQLEGSSGSLYISVGRWPPTLCAITGARALFQTPKPHLHRLPAACSLSDRRTDLSS